MRAQQDLARDEQVLDVLHYVMKSLDVAAGRSDGHVEEHLLEVELEEAHLQGQIVQPEPLLFLKVLCLLLQA